MRLFVAVDVPEHVKDAIESDVVGVLRLVLQGARWTRPEGRHLTLAFLGEKPDELVDEIAGALRSAVVGLSAFDASFDAIGGFPNLRRPRVLWVGIGPGAEAMAALARDVQRSLVPFGYKPEDRPFAAHFTLTRFPKPSVIDALPDVVVPTEPFTVREVVLFRSHLHPKGARYTALERFPLE